MPPHISAEHVALARAVASRYHAKGSLMDAADLAQEAVLAACLALPVYDPARHQCPVEAYLATCIKSHLSRLVGKDNRRAERAAAEPLGDDFLDARPGPEEAADREDALGHAARVLPRWEADVLAMAAAGHGTQRIALALGLTPATVRAYRARAAAKVRGMVA